MSADKLIDNAPESKSSSSAYGQTPVSSGASELDRNKRRLVQGAVAAGPVLLTLRSGVLAAASCVPIKASNVPVNDDGKIDTTNYDTTNALAPNPDICYATINTDSCPAGTTSTAGNVPIGEVVKQGSDYRCQNWNQQSHSNNVAILSWGAAHSIMG